MADVKVASFWEMEPIYDGLARRARVAWRDVVRDAGDDPPGKLGRLPQPPP